MNESKATRHQRQRRRARTSSLIWGGGVLAVVALTPIASWIRDLTLRMTDSLPPSSRAVAAPVLFVLFVVALWQGATLPGAVRNAGRIGRGSSRDDTDGLILAHLRAAAATGLGALVAAAVVRLAVAVAGPWWWVPAAATLAAFWAGLLRLGPLVLSHAGAVRPIRRPDLRERLAALAEQVRVRVAGIHEWAVASDATATAIVAGVGPSRRVFVSSAILRDWSDEEIAVVVAHELAHHRYHDLWRAFGLHAIVLSVGLALASVAVTVAGPRLGLEGSDDLATLPLIGLVAGAVWVLSTPVRHAQSRAHERRADRFALSATGASGAFRTAIRRLSAQHLAEERPSQWTQWLHHAHPTIAERLAAADEFGRHLDPPAPSS
jgi:STE24 endopeptidase